MSEFIENTARGALNMLTGDEAADQAAAHQADRGQKLISNWATGGLALGGGLGAAVALVNYLRSLRQEAELNDESRLNDDTLYIPAPNTKEASDSPVNRWLAPGLAVTGGVLSAGGAYALTQAVYNWLQKKKRQRMLDEAQAEALLAADVEAGAKSASADADVRMTLSDLLTAFPVAIPLLTALASGGVAYAALNKTFPTVKKPVSKYPRRIRQLTPDGELVEVETDHTKKASALNFEALNDFEDAGYEFLLMTTDALAGASKSASITSDLLHRAADTGASQLSADLREHGLAAFCEMLKGASDTPVDATAKAASAAAVVKDPRLGPVAKVIAAAEWMDMVPNLSRYCAQMDGAHLCKLAKLAPLLHLSGSRPLVAEFAKSATADSPLLAELLALAENVPANATDPDEEQRDKALTSDVSGSLAEDDEGETDTTEDDLSNESQSADDIVDAAFETEFGQPAA